MAWRTAKLGDICTIEKGNIGITKAITGEYPLVVLGAERKTHNDYQFDDEAVIIPLVSSTGHGHRSMKRIFFQKGKFSVGSILCAVIPKDKTQLSAEFLYRYLDFNKEKELVSRMRGMANVTLPIKEIADVEIPLPSLEEQEQLIERFQKLESNKNQISIELNHQLALVKELRQAYLREAMQGKLVAQAEADEPAQVLLEKIKAEKERLIKEKKIKQEKPLPPIKPEEIPFEVPANWAWCRLGEIIELVSGQHIDSTDYNENGEGFPYLTGPSDFGEKYPLPTRWTIKPKVFANKEDILITVKGSGVGKINISNLHKVVISRQLMAIRATFVLRNFIYFFLEYSFDLLQSEKKGTGIPGISRENILEKIFPLPPLAEQERIVAKLEKLMKFCDELETNIKQARANADMLLQVALKEALK